MVQERGGSPAQQEDHHLPRGQVRPRTQWGVGVLGLGGWDPWISYGCVADSLVEKEGCFYMSLWVGWEQADPSGLTAKARCREGSTWTVFGTHRKARG